jgi:hypothetical protein
MKVVMLFLDGVGIGAKDPRVNPVWAASMPALRSLLDGELPSLRRRALRSSRAAVIPLDANLGVPGLPQSGTGQTALFTGVNGAAVAGRHFGPHPYSTLKPIIRDRNIFRRLLDAKKNPCFANAFPQRFFDYMDQKRARLTVTTLSCVSAGIPLLRAPDLAAGRGISADITGEGWKGLGYPDMESITPQEAGRRLALLGADHDFVLFEYWRTDHAGHAMKREEAVAVLEAFDGLLGGLLGALDLTASLLLITSDHGNIEDITVKTHTRHPVPLIVAGRRHAEFIARLRNGRAAPPDLTCVTPAVLDAVCEEEPRQAVLSL